MPNPPMLQALSGTRPDTTPVWFMRQAGRSLPEYREVRRGTGMLESCLMPELAAEITLQPVRRHHVDAAVFFSDIMVPLKLAGVAVEIQSGVGPVVAQPVRTPADVDALVAHRLEDLSPITEAVRLTVDGLGGVPLLGFGGAPFTLAAYLVEGRPSRDHLAARGLMLADPESWHRLAAWCAEVTGAFLAAQVDAGASAVQLFDSWAGSLSREDYATLVAPHSRAALAAVADRVPTIHYAAGAEHLLEAIGELGTTTVGIDHRVPLSEAARRLPGRVLQGNLDPAVLTAPWPVVQAAVRRVLDEGRAAPAHVFNLGHGVPPTTDPDVLTRIVEEVHAHA